MKGEGEKEGSKKEIVGVGVSYFKRSMLFDARRKYVPDYFGRTFRLMRDDLVELAS